MAASTLSSDKAAVKGRRHAPLLVGLLVAALVAAGYTVYPVNPLQASRYRERHGVSRAKSDAGDAHMLADMVRTDSHQLRPAAGDSPEAEGIKVLARTHKTLIWERTRQVQRLRHQLREYFPAALEAFADLDAPDTLELLARAPDPARAARLTRAQVSAALKRARRRDIPGKAAAILAVLRSAARIAVALSVTLRRPARLSAALTCARVSFAARAWSGALPSSSSTSGASRSSNAASAAGKYSRSWCRSRCTARVRSQISVLCVRATTLMPWPSGESPAAGRS